MRSFRASRQCGYVAFQLIQKPFRFPEVSLLKFYRDIAPYLRRHRLQYVVGSAAVLMVVIFTTLLPRFLGRAIDLLNRGEATFGSLSRYALLLGGVALTSAVFNLLQRRQMIVASRQIEAELRSDLYSHLAHLDRAFYDRARTGDVMNRLASDLLSVRDMLGPGLNMGSRVILLAVAALVAMIALEPRLGGLVAATVPLMIGIVAYLRRLVAVRFGAAQEKLSEIAAKTQENFSGARVVRGYALEARELAAFNALNDEYLELNLGLARVEAPLAAIMGLLMALASLILLLYGGQLVIFADMSVGDYVAFTTYLAMLSTPVVAIGRLVTIYQRGATSWERLDDLFKTGPRVRDKGQRRVRALDADAGKMDPPDPHLLRIQGAITFDHVSLTLGGQLVLKDVNLHLPAGSSLGVTGRTGSGKTLLCDLLTRQFDPSSGAVLLDGVDLRELPLSSLRDHVAVVAQEPFLFSDTIAENIAFGLPGSRALTGDQVPDSARVERAAALSALTGDVESFPAGFGTSLGERGVTLSGGQRGRTAIARAVAREPSILVLDDALSAVDTETESRILHGLRETMQGRTTLLVSHRASTLRETDQIIVLEDGRIVERGTHRELLAQGGRYAALERRQRAAPTLADEDVAEGERKRR